MNFENPSQKENSGAREERQREEGKRISRFSGGKARKVVRMLMLATALAGSYEGVVHREEISEEVSKIVTSINERDKTIEKEITHHAVGVVVRKEYVPMGTIGYISHPERWYLTVLVDGEESTADVSREQFDYFKDGDKVQVTYEIRGFGSLEHRENVTVETTK